MDDEDRCDQCGSTDFTVEDDGHTYCVNGHEQARGVIIAEDEQDFGRQGKVVRKKEKKSKQKVSKVLRGAKAYRLYLQSWQYILWKQCHTLVHQLGLPAELWAIVRDLWSLWLSRLASRLNDSSSGPGHVPEGESETERDLHATSADDTDTDTGGVDTDADERPPTENNHKAVRKGPRLIDTVVLSYLAMILLRCPIELATILRWIQVEDIPFIRAIRHVPQEMKDRLPSEYHAALDTLRMPLPDDLQLAVYQRSLMYDVFFGMVTPPLNHNLLFISYMRSLALPIEAYSLAQRLNRITKYSFAYPDQSTAAVSSSRRRHATSYPEAQIISLIVTATKLLYPFDSDTVLRHPKSPNDLATLRMDWSAWLTAKTAMETPSELDPAGEEDLKPGSEIAVTDEDVLNMNDTQLDQYLDWYQRTWLNAAPGAASTNNNNQSQTQTQSQSQNQSQNQETNTIDQTILNLFPLQPLPSTQKTRTEHTSAAQKREALLSVRIERVQASLSPIRAITPAEEATQRTTILRPGARYPRYRWVEELGGAEGWSEAARVFHEEAAQVACLGVPALLRAVARTEDVIEAWRREKRREEYFAATADEEEAGTGEEDGPGEPVGRIGLGPGFGEVPSSSAALVRGLGELELQDIDSPSFATGAGEKGDGDYDDDDDDDDDEGEEEAEEGGERDVEMEMAMEYLNDL